MCCSGGEVAKTDEALQAAQLQTANVLSKEYAINLSQQQSVLGQETAKLNYIIANPMGYSPAQLHAAKTSINENTATAAKQAIGAAAAFAASHGAADVGGGGAGMMAGQIASEAATSKAAQLSSLSQQNEEQKQKNLWAGLSGLHQVGAEYGGASGTAIGSDAGVVSSGVNAGEGATQAKYAGMQAFGSVLSGVAGLAKAGASFLPGH